jgi:hypothetical protein
MNATASVCATAGNPPSGEQNASVTATKISASRLLSAFPEALPLESRTLSAALLDLHDVS